MVKDLQYSVLFAGFDEVEIMAMLKKTHYNIKHFNRGDLIAISGEKVDTLMMVIDGCVRGEMLDSSGKVFRIEDIKSLGIISPGFIFGSNNKFPVNVVANCDTDILSIPKISFVDMLNANARLMVNYLDIISDKTQFLAVKIKNVFLQSIQGKIANYLITTAKERNQLEFNMENSQTWLAEKFSVARPSVARVFAEMKAKGIIEMQGKKVKINNIDALKKCVNNI